MEKVVRRVVCDRCGEKWEGDEDDSVPASWGNALCYRREERHASIDVCPSCVTEIQRCIATTPARPEPSHG